MKCCTKYVLTLSIVLTSISAFMMNTELAINLTPSMPYRYFLIVKGLPVKKGDIASIGGHKTKYLGDLRFLKRIDAVEGDSIQLKDVKRQTLTGKPLTPLKKEIVPKGFVFVQADHKDSFDSRYEEFGLVSVQHIRGRGFPLW